MEDHTDTTERTENFVNLMIRGPREDQNEENFVTDNRDGDSSDDELNSLHGISSKRHKYSVNQIQELDIVFKENSHPDEKTRLELTTKFSVGKKQVQFRFQNKRSILKSWKIQFCDPCRNKDTIRNGNIDEKEILNEHASLKNELTRIAIHADKFLGPSTFLEGSLTSIMEILGWNYLREEMKLLLKLAMSNEPFWVRSLNGGGEILNIEEYARSFIQIVGIKPSHFTTEATRSFGTVAGNSLTLVEILMNESQWIEMFPCIIGKVNTFDFISTGIGESKSGTLLLILFLESINLQIETELQIISNVVPVCEIQFLRFCQKYAEGTWIIVDVSVDTIKEVDSKGEIGMRILAQRMTRNFCAGIFAISYKCKTIKIENGKDTNLMMRKNISDPSEPICVVLSATNTIKLSIKPQYFMLIFQDTCTDATSSLLVYAIVDSSKMNTVMKMLGGGGLFLFQMLVGNLSTTDLPEKSIIDANDIISHTIHKIKTALKCK
ncbi:hypothetical protein R3W88_016415 [Solanum pinnatisectum]|uniref:START domain-containing protein n=1 Tax=Solanum pinnatisectum TaxID=50273 RepID=A0AAV9L1J0_9SOLN|nr:hypothetical protein R3W88_016415 [Solanum pinnatisectum]